MHWHIVHCFTSCVIWKLHRCLCSVVEFRNLCFMNSNCDMVQEILLRLQQLHQTRSGRPKTRDSKAVLLAIEANPASSTQRVSGEHLHDLGKKKKTPWLPNCPSHYQNIAKLLTHLSIWITAEIFIIFWILIKTSKKSSTNKKI